jgi:hypothetical protein
MNNTYYTVEQVADLLSLHPKTVQRYIREGKLARGKARQGLARRGHDLSVFAESATAEGRPDIDGGAADVTVSAVADIRVAGREAAIRVMNALTASANAKPPEYGAPPCTRSISRRRPRSGSRSGAARALRQCCWTRSPP